MKFILLVIFLITLCQGFEDACRGPALKAIFLKCITDSGASSTDLGDWIISKPSKTQEAKCLRACVLQECQYFDEEDKIHSSVPKRLGYLLNGGFEAHTEAIEIAAEYCRNVTEKHDSRCDTAESFVRCLVERCKTPLILHGVL